MSSSNRKGKIIVIETSEIGKDKLIGIVKNMGINKDGFVFYLDYKDSKTFEFSKAEWSENYAAILVG